MSGREFFARNYEEARGRFRDLARARRAQLASFTLAARGPANESLTIDTAWIGPPEASCVLLHVSGVHGVEGFMGNAVQCGLLKQPLPLAADQAVLMVHAVNPFGMAWLRRVNENNVDLNRNFLLSAQDYQGTPPVYARLNPWLNKPKPAGRFEAFYLRLAWYALRFGYRSLQQAIAGGQYDFPRGLFFGGRSLEDGPRWLLDWLAQQLKAVEKIVVLDLHSGLGKFAHDMLMVPSSIDAQTWEALRVQLGHRVVAAAGGGYTASGAFYEMVQHVVPHARCWSVVQEFGTYAQLRVLKALRAENKLWWYGPRDDLSHPVKRNFREMFCPQHAFWQRTILARGRAVAEQALELLTM